MGQDRHGGAENRPCDAELVQGHDDPRHECRVHHQRVDAGQQRPGVLRDHAEARHLAPCQQQAEDGGHYVRAGIQREADVGAVEHRAGEHFRERDVADDIGDDCCEQGCHRAPGGHADDAVRRRCAGALMPVLRRHQQPDQHRGRDQRQCERVDPVVQRLADQEDAEPVQQVQDRAYDRPATEHLEYPLRQQAQHRHQRQQQRCLVQHQRCVREEERDADEDEEEPRRKRAPQHLGGGLHGRFRHHRPAAAPAEPDQERQQYQRAELVGAQARLLGGTPFFQECGLETQTGFGPLQFGGAEPGVRPGRPDRLGINDAEPAVVVGDRRIDTLPAGVDAGLHGVGPPAQLQLIVERPRQRSFRERELPDDHVDAIGQRRSDAACKHCLTRCLPRTAPSREFRCVFGVGTGRAVERGPPVIEFALVEPPVVIEAFEPDRRELLQVFVFERLRQPDDPGRQDVEFRTQLLARVLAFRALDGVLRKALVHIGAHRDVAGGDRLRHRRLRRGLRGRAGLARARQQSRLGAGRPGNCEKQAEHRAEGTDGGA